VSVTIQEVAEAAGVSKATVSKVLHKSYSISQETCDRVNAVIKELGYQPNRRAQSFATGATKTILFLAEMQHGVGFDNPHLFEIMAGVENALSEKGYGLIVQHSTALDLWQNFDELLQGSYVDGVILHASVVSKDVALCLAHTELPYIVVGAPDFSNQLCWIDTNNSVAGQIAVTHLWRNGYDRIAFIGGPKEDTISAHRLSGALATLNEKIPAGYLREGPPTSEGGAAAARALLELPTRPNAVICANQYIAFGCVNELKGFGDSDEKKGLMGLFKKAGNRLESMKAQYSKVEANVGAPQVAYKETVRKKVNHETKYKRQSGGSGQYGHVKITLEPNESGKGYEFVNAVVGGAIPKEYIPAIDAGIQGAMQAGVLAGYPVVDVKVTLYDGSYHEVDSSEMAFKIAGSMAFKEAMREADPVLLEPIMKVCVIVPDEYMGDVIGDLNARRGQIQGYEMRSGAQQIDAFVPLSEMFGYATNLRSRTQGRGQYTMEPSHYVELPKSLQEKLVSKRSGHEA